MQTSERYIYACVEGRLCKATITSGTWEGDNSIIEWGGGWQEKTNHMNSQCKFAAYYLSSDF